MAQLVGFLHNINISGHFWPKLGFLTPSDAHFLGSPQLLAIDIEDIASQFNPNVFLWLLWVIYWPTWEDFCIISIFSVIFGQNLCFWPPGVPIYRDPFNCNAVDYEDIAIRFTLNVFFVYFVLSNGPNWEDFCIISIFGVIFGQNLGFWPPGVPIYRVPLNCYAVDYEDIASRFNLNAFLWLLCFI